MILFPVSVNAPPNEVRGWMLTLPFSLAFKTAAAPPVASTLVRLRASDESTIHLDAEA